MHRLKLLNSCLRLGQYTTLQARPVRTSLRATGGRDSTQESLIPVTTVELQNSVRALKGPREHAHVPERAPRGRPVPARAALPPSAPPGGWTRPRDAPPAGAAGALTARGPQPWLSHRVSGRVTPTWADRGLERGLICDEMNSSFPKLYNQNERKGTVYGVPPTI